MIIGRALRRAAVAAGAVVAAGCFQVAPASAQLFWDWGGGSMVDGSGRAGLIRRKLGLTRPASHNANAVWFRMGRRLKIDDWSESRDWQSWIPTRDRWMSTVHLMGKGYWTWLIPLASDSHSIGIVADDGLHPYQSLNRFDRAMRWLHTFEPQCAEVLEAHRDDDQRFNQRESIITCNRKDVHFHLHP